MIRQACVVGVALALVAGCKTKDEPSERVEEIQIAPPTGERPYMPADLDGDGLEDLDPADRWDGYDRPAERRSANRADERPLDRGDDRADREARERDRDRVATRQDLQRALEDADRRIERIRTTQSLSDAEESDLDALERRLREVRQDLDAIKDEAAEDWDESSDQLRIRLRRINRSIERVEENEA